MKQIQARGIHVFRTFGAVAIFSTLVFGAAFGTALISAHAVRAQDKPIAEMTASEVADARETLFKGLGMRIRLLSRMAKGRDDFDAAQARTHAAEMAELAATIVSLFPPGTETTPKSEALPVIWQDQETFAARASALQEATLALANAEGTFTQADLGAAFKRIGGACSACHDRFRADH